MYQLLVNCYIDTLLNLKIENFYENNTHHRSDFRNRKIYR